MLAASRTIVIGFSAILAALTVERAAWAQPGPSIPRRGPTPLEFQNQIPARMIDAVRNELIEPIPLTAKRLEITRQEVDREILNQVQDLKERIKDLFPDELDALAQTGTWTPQQRNDLSKALKAHDPAAVYKAWLEAQPDNTTGAEGIARETAVEQTFYNLEQRAQDAQVEPENVTALQDALAKLAQVQPSNDDIKGNLNALRTWTQIRQILETTQPETAAIGILPTGNVRLIFNPNLNPETAIVLSDDTVMVGDRGKAGVRIGKGNAAEALGMPVVSGRAVPGAEGSPISAGSLLLNPKTSGATVHYLVNGMAYEMEPGMSQWLPPGTAWRIEFDRGGALGATRYRLPEGTFRFNPTDTGWDLYQDRYDVTLDNSRDPKDFHVVVDDQRMVVRGGHTKMLSSLYPITIRYDRGNSSGFVTKKLNFSGTVEIAINAADNLWDVFVESGNKKAPVDVNIFMK